MSLVSKEFLSVDGGGRSSTSQHPGERRKSHRLLSVGTTRVQTHLTLTDPKRKRGYDRQPTPFVDDIPEARPQLTDDGRT